MAPKRKICAAMKGKGPAKPALMMGGGRARASAAARRALPLGQRRSSTATAKAGPDTGGRITPRGRGGRDARALGGRDGAPALPPKGEAHTAVAAHEFIVGLHHRPRSWLQLPDSFARVMEDNGPLGLWLQADGYCNGPSWVATEFSLAGFMFLKR